jgi:hypothetical protein
VSHQTTNRSFDDLARALAEGSISRRRALKLFAGTAIASLIPSRALADDDDDECVRVCHVPKTATGACDLANARTICVSRRERRRHLNKHSCDTRGRCQTSNTTTTSSTTSTSTSTTSTSTTPMCQPIDGTCSANGQCCSGRCAGSTCAEPCTTDRTTLSNGTCAKPCTSDDDCGGFPCGCFNIVGDRHFCATSGGSGNFCDFDLPEFCVTGEICSVGLCFLAC